MGIPSRPVEPGPNPEALWDHPRPLRIEAVTARLRVLLAGVTTADTHAALRVLETNRPPVYYFPAKGVDRRCLQPSKTRSWCEFKGAATYWSITTGGRSAENAAWNYLNPTAGFQFIASFFAFYPGKVDECWVGDESVLSQQGHFYGGLDHLSQHRSVPRRTGNPGVVKSTISPRPRPIVPTAAREPQAPEAARHIDAHGKGRSLSNSGERCP